MKAVHQLCLAAVVAALVATPGTASAAPSEDSEGGGPWGRGTMMPSLGFGASFSSDIHVLDFGLGFDYFVWDGLGVGLSFSDTVLIYRPDYKAAFPGIENETPSNIVRLIPSLQYVFLRRSRFSPFLRAGVGPVFYNRKRGTIGEWVLGAGAYFRLAGPVSLALGVDFYANFPDDDWKDAFSYMGQSIRGCAIVDNPCSFNISPRLGIVFMFGGGKSKRRKRSEQPPEEPAPAYNPMEPEPAPLEPEPIEPAPVEPPPAEPPPAEPAEPPPAEPAPADSPPPTDPAAQTPPPAEPPGDPVADPAAGPAPAEPTDAPPPPTETPAAPPPGDAPPP